MSGTQIPNLNTLRRGGSRDGRGGFARPPSSRQPPLGNHNHNDDNDDPSLPTRFAINQFRVPQRTTGLATDAAIAQTDLEAARSRLEIQKLGYIEDDFVQWLNPAASQPVNDPIPMMPRTEKNRGTFLRTWAIDHLIEHFLKATPPESRSPLPIRRQIVSLGAGTDSRYFRWLKKLADRSLTPATDGRQAAGHVTVDLKYHEIDMAMVSHSKVLQVKSPAFREHLQNLTSIALQGKSPELGSFHCSDGSQGYHIYPFDLARLRDHTAGAGLKETFTSIDEDVPTLIFSELCLMYLETQKADNVLQWFMAAFPESTPIGLVILEPIKPFDALGQQMAQRIAEQNIRFTTIREYPELIDQKKRLARLGFVSSDRHIGAASAMDWWSIWNRCLDRRERERVEALEAPLDEIDYLKELFQHYCLAWGYRDGTNKASESPFAGWCKMMPADT